MGYRQENKSITYHSFGQSILFEVDRFNKKPKLFLCRLALNLVTVFVLYDSLGGVRFHAERRRDGAGV
jgi:hypothetical protein